MAGDEGENVGNGTNTGVTEPNQEEAQLPLLLPVEMELEDVEREVNILLAGVESVEDFQAIYKAIDFPVPTPEPTTTARYYKELLRHLNSPTIDQSTDNGLQVFLKVYYLLVGEEGDNNHNKPITNAEVPGRTDTIPKVESNGSSSSLKSAMASGTSASGGKLNSSM